MWPLLALACAPPDAARGVLVNGLTGAPVVGATVRAEAADEGCLRVSSVSDDDGAFVLEAPCPDSVLVPVDPLWWSPVAVAASREPRLELWRAPPTPGLYALQGTELVTLTTNTPLGTLHLPAGAVRYPLLLPGEPPRLLDGDHVVLAGAEVADWSLAPLVPTPALRVDGPDGASRFDPWFAVGLRVADDGSITPVEAAVVATDIVGGVTGGNPPSQDPGHPDRYRYLPVAELDSGRWLLGQGQGSRGVVVDLVDR